MNQFWNNCVLVIAMTTCCTQTQVQSDSFRNMPLLRNMDTWFPLNIFIMHGWILKKTWPKWPLWQDDMSLTWYSATIQRKPVVASMSYVHIVMFSCKILLYILIISIDFNSRIGLLVKMRNWSVILWKWLCLLVYFIVDGIDLLYIVRFCIWLCYN